MTLSYQDLAFTGPETIARRFLRLFWQPVFISKELAVGRTKPIRIMSEDFTLYRGNSGSPYLLQFRCAHRGTQLSLGWVEKDDIRCRYHGWKYDGTGQCVEQPGEAKSFASRIKLKSYPVQEYLGMIFAYLGEGKAPALPRYPRFEQGLIRARSRVCRSNYWYHLDNNLDLYHSEWAHRHRHADYEEVHTAGSVPGSLDAWETEWGMTAQIRLADGEARVQHSGMPTMELFSTVVLSTGMVTENLNWRVPIDDASHLTFGLRQIPNSEAGREGEGRSREALGTPEDPAKPWVDKILRGDLSIEDVIDRTDVRDEGKINIVNVQDDVTQIGQGGIADREREHLGSTDKGVALARRIWMRELTALAEGRPLKEWRFSDAIQSSFGEKKERAS